MIEGAAIVLILAVTIDGYIAARFARRSGGIGGGWGLGCLGLRRTTSSCGSAIGQCRLGRCYARRRRSGCGCYDGNSRAACRSWRQRSVECGRLDLLLLLWLLRMVMLLLHARPVVKWELRWWLWWLLLLLIWLMVVVRSSRRVSVGEVRWRLWLLLMLVVVGRLLRL